MKKLRAPKHTFALRGRVAPGSRLCTMKLCFPDQRVARVTPVADRHPAGERFHGLAVVLPIGDGWSREALHLYREREIIHGQKPQ